jgi:hypothetical protein
VPGRKKHFRGHNIPDCLDLILPLQARRVEVIVVLMGDKHNDVFPLDLLGIDKAEGKSPRVRGYIGAGPVIKDKQVVSGLQNETASKKMPDYRLARSQLGLKKLGWALLRSLEGSRGLTLKGAASHQKTKEHSRRGVTLHAIPRYFIHHDRAGVIGLKSG